MFSLSATKSHNKTIETKKSKGESRIQDIKMALPISVRFFQQRHEQTNEREREQYIMDKAMSVSVCMSISFSVCLTYTNTQPLYPNHIHILIPLSESAQHSTAKRTTTTTNTTTTTTTNIIILIRPRPSVRLVGLIDIYLEDIFVAVCGPPSFLPSSEWCDVTHRHRRIGMQSVSAQHQKQRYGIQEKSSQVESSRGGVSRDWTLIITLHVFGLFRIDFISLLSTHHKTRLWNSTSDISFELTQTHSDMTLIRCARGR